MSAYDSSSVDETVDESVEEDASSSGTEEEEEEQDASSSSASSSGSEEEKDDESDESGQSIVPSDAGDDEDDEDGARRPAAAGGLLGRAAARISFGRPQKITLGQGCGGGGSRHRRGGGRGTPAGRFALASRRCRRIVPVRVLREYSAEMGRGAAAGATRIFRGSRRRRRVD